jgi:predicted SnoaL-like aldol condensation-catalyzing enzyme
MSASSGSKRLIFRLYDELLNGGNVDVIVELFSTTWINYGPFPDPKLVFDFESLRRFYAELLDGFSVKATIRDIIAEGDRVAYRASVTTSPKDSLQGGRVETTTEIHIARVTHGRLAEHWGVLTVTSA